LWDSVQKNDSFVLGQMIGELHIAEISLRREWESTAGASRSKVHRKQVKEYWSRVVSTLHLLHIVQQKRVPFGSIWAGSNPNAEVVDVIHYPPTKNEGRIVAFAKLDDSDDLRVDIPEPRESSFSLLATIAEAAALLALFKARGNKNPQVSLLQQRICIPPRPSSTAGRPKYAVPVLWASPYFWAAWYQVMPTVKDDSTLTSVAQEVRAIMSKQGEQTQKLPAESTIRKALKAIQLKTAKNNLP
jgi:hypothetical protein